MVSREVHTLSLRQFHIETKLIIKLNEQKFISKTPGANPWDATVIHQARYMKAVNQALCGGSASPLFSRISELLSDI